MDNTLKMATNKIWFPFFPAEWEITTQNLQTLKNDSSSTNQPAAVFIPCNNPENLLDPATTTRVRSMLYMTVLATIEIFGVITNVINCIVFVRQGLKDRINLCLFSLALADISFLTLLFSAKFFSFLGLFDKELEDYWDHKQREVVLGSILASLMVSNMMTMIISVERCICVASPFTAKKFLKTRYMAVIIVVMVIYIFGIFSMRNVKYSTAHVTDPETNTSHWVTRLTAFYKNNRMVMDILFNHLLKLTVPSLSLLVVITTTSVTITKLTQSLAWRQQTTNVKVSAGEATEAAVTKMLIVICCIYVTTTTPSVTQAYVKTLIDDYGPQGKYCNTFRLVQTLAHVCEVTNSSANFIVYFTMGTRFRVTVQQLFGTWRENKEISKTQSAPAI